ncbi:MAG: hypothetical protein JEY99_16865 [Spirochaetales bacterium]|nr:hypothetical protein [Spirochaetales bacterium]
MKKFFRFILVIIILVILGGGFYLGWIQFDLEENDYAVAFTKTGGYSSQVLEPGKFIWMWQKLIPTNMKLHVFNLDPRKTTLSLSGTLPSGDIYREVLEGVPSFDYTFQFDLTYRLKPENLPALAEDGFLTPDNINGWFSQFEDNCTIKAVEYLQEQAVNKEFYGVKSGDSSLVEQKLAAYLTDFFPEIDFMSIIPVKIVMPDVELYQAGKDEYFSLMAAKHQMNLEALQEASTRTMNQLANLDLLGRYGELLTTYPILIEYLDKNPVLSEDLIMSLQGE